MFTITNTENGSTIELTRAQMETAWLALMIRAKSEQDAGLNETADNIYAIADAINSTTWDHSVFAQHLRNC